MGLETYGVVAHADRKTSAAACLLPQSLHFQILVRLLWLEGGYLRAEGTEKKAEEHGGVEETSLSLKLPELKSESSQLPRKQVKNRSG